MQSGLPPLQISDLSAGSCRPCDNNRAPTKGPTHGLPSAWRWIGCLSLVVGPAKLEMARRNCTTMAPYSARGCLLSHWWGSTLAEQLFGRQVQASSTAHKKTEKKPDDEMTETPQTRNSNINACYLPILVSEGLSLRFAGAGLRSCARAMISRHAPPPHPSRRVGR